MYSFVLLNIKQGKYFSQCLNPFEAVGRNRSPSCPPDVSDSKYLFEKANRGGRLSAANNNHLHDKFFRSNKVKSYFRIRPARKRLNRVCERGVTRSSHLKTKS